MTGKAQYIMFAIGALVNGFLAVAGNVGGWMPFWVTCICMFAVLFDGIGALVLSMPWWRWWIKPLDRVRVFSGVYIGDEGIVVSVERLPGFSIKTVFLRNENGELIEPPETYCARIRGVG